MSISKQSGFDSIIELLSILHDLSTSRDSQLLSNSTFTNEEFSYNSRRIEKVFEHMNANFSKQITLYDVAKIANMPCSSFSRFIRKRTGVTFMDCLNEIRLGHISRMLIDTTQSISEIAYTCGFNNMANFNRTFKRKKGCTPKEFRENYLGKTVFV